MDIIVQIFGVSFFIAFFVFYFVLGIGHMTCSDYFDKIYNYKTQTPIIFIFVITIFALLYIGGLCLCTDNFTLLTILKVTTIVTVPITVYCVSIVLIKIYKKIRKYFKNKRGK